jgi:hypothetical protein
LVKRVTSSPEFSHAVAADAFRVMNQLPNVNAVTDAIFLSPRDLYDVIATFQPVLSAVSESSPAFGAAVDVLVAIGKTATKRDASVSARLFSDFCLPTVVPIIRRSPTKRHAMLRLLYAFCQTTSTGHLEVWRAPWHCGHGTAAHTLPTVPWQLLSLSLSLSLSLPHTLSLSLFPHGHNMHTLAHRPTRVVVSLNGHACLYTWPMAHCVPALPCVCRPSECCRRVSTRWTCSFTASLS